MTNRQLSTSLAIKFSQSRSSIRQNAERIVSRQNRQLSASLAINLLTIAIINQTTRWMNRFITKQAIICLTGHKPSHTAITIINQTTSWMNHFMTNRQLSASLAINLLTITIINQTKRWKNRFTTKQAIICLTGHKPHNHDHQSVNRLNESFHDKKGNYLPHWP